MKKTAEETLRKYSRLRSEVAIKKVTEAMKVYAAESIKADRERIKDEIKIHQAIYVSKGFYHPAENLIDNLPI